MEKSLNYLTIFVVSSCFMAVTPAEAGRCGHSYPVDKPTTLTEVARQCNVNLSALYEANPGVDPSNVRPGEHLAVPDEIDAYVGSVSARQVAAETASPVSEGSAHPYIVSRTYDAPITDDIGLSANYDASQLKRISARDDQVVYSSPIWLREETLGARRHTSSDRLSYQKLSALRILNAGLAKSPSRSLVSMPVVRTELIECPVLRSGRDGKIHKVRKIISTPENTFVEINATANGDGFDCTLVTDVQTVPLTPGVPAARFNKTSNNNLSSDVTGYRVPDYNKIGFIPVAPAPVLSNEPMMLSGYVFDLDQGCALLKTSNGDLWRLSADQTARSLLGKRVNVWGTSTRNDNVCGAGVSVKISHAVYAEPWAK